MAIVKMNTKGKHTESEEASSSPNPNDPIIVTAVGGGRRKVVSRGVSILDFVLRVIAAGGTLGSAIAMGTTDETLFLNQNFQIRAQYNDLPSLTFFVIANSVVFGYLVLSLPASIFHIFKPAAKSSRIILVIFDTVMLAIVTAAASAATSIVYLAHKGNLSANWASACQQLDNFCKRISGSLVGSFGAALVFMPIIITSVIAISRS